MPSPADVDEILQRVALGELSPEAAHCLLNGSVPDAPSTDAPSSEAPSTGAPSTGTTVRVNVSYRSIEVVADPGVRELAVDGRHTVHRDGAVLVIEATDSPFSVGENRDGTPSGPRFSFDDLPRSLAWARGWKNQSLLVRVNPALSVEVDAAGASVRVRGTSAGTRLRLVASSATIESLRGSLDVDAFTSSVKGSAALTGDSRLACESSSVRLSLAAGSDVTIKSHNRMGRVVLPESVSTVGRSDAGTTTARIGAGTATFEVEALMSSVTLTSQATA